MIGNVINKVRYTVLSTTPVVSGYSIPFKYWDVSQISVILTSSTGVETQVASASLSVTSPGDTGTLTFAAGYTFPEGTSVLTVVRTLTIEQLSDYRNGDVMDAEQLEKSFDMTVAMLQELNEKIARTVRIPISDPASILQMPSSLIRANMLLGFDAEGNTISILTTDIEQKLADALAAEDSVLAMYNDPGMVEVRTDMADPETSSIQAVADNKANIDIVAGDIGNVNAVGANIANVNAVAGNEANINAVNANKPNVDIVAGDITNVNAVGGNITNVLAVAGNEANINAVNANKTNIDAAVANETNINIAAGNIASIIAVNNNQDNIDRLATDIAAGALSMLKIVSDAIADIILVGTDISSVNNVSYNLSRILSVANNLAAIQYTLENMEAIIDAQAFVDDALILNGNIETALARLADYTDVKDRAEEAAVAVEKIQYGPIKANLKKVTQSVLLDDPEVIYYGVDEMQIDDDVTVIVGDDCSLQII